MRHVKAFTPSLAPALAAATLVSLLLSSLAATPAAAERPTRQPAEGRRAEAAPPPPPLQAEGPLLMLISLNQQRMFVYDAKGLLTTTRVATGMAGFETPKGIYSIIDKKEDHESNIFEGAPMPFMQRLLFTGIALHGGVVPGYPASHGCIRLPHDFARKFFPMTQLNERVVITPDVQAPVAIQHPLLFTALPSGVTASVDPAFSDKTAASAPHDDAGTLLGITPVAAAQTGGRTLATVAEDRIKERERLVAAAATAKDVRAGAVIKASDAAKAADDARVALKRGRSVAEGPRRAAAKAADAQKNSERAIAAITKRLAGDLNRIAADKLEALRASEPAERERLATLTATAAAAAGDYDKAKADVAALESAVRTADAARAQAKAGIKTAATAETAAAAAVTRFDHDEALRSYPVSVFISSKTGKVSIRQGFEHISDAQLTITRPEQPLGTFLFTATGWRDHSQTSLNWTVAAVTEQSLPAAEPSDHEKPRRKKEIATPPPATDATAAAAALDRLQIPRDVLDKISEVAKPGSTLILSDYDVAKSETRKGTDFIVQMPEVVARISRPQPKPRYDDYDDNYGSFWDNPSPRRPRSYGSRNYW